MSETATLCTCATDASFLRSERPPYEALRPRVRLVDLFSGCGGLTLGAAEAARSLGLGVDIRLAVDMDPDAVAVYKANFPEADVRCEPVEEFFDGKPGRPLTAAEKKVKRQVGRVDVLLGGPPCQGHSDLNNRTRRADPRNALYATMARAADVLRPSLVLVENVPTVTHDVEKVVEATVESLESSGFGVTEAVVDVSRLGAPQRRRRHVVLASRDGRVDVEALVDELQPRCPRHSIRSVRWAIEDLVKAQSEATLDSASVPSSDNVKRIRWLFENRKYDLPNRLRPDCHRSDHSYNSMYGRLHWDQPAQTVTTGFGSMGQGRYVHPSRRRTITPHEAARLQMLPDFWDFAAVKTKVSLARLIGNAVPPVLASALLELALDGLGLGPTVPFPLPSKRTLPSKASRGSSRRGGESSSRRRRGVPQASSAEARTRMKATRQRDTAAELALRREIDDLGLRYKPDATLPASRRRADLVFEDACVVVLVDGCFWHGCPIHGTLPKANAKWWKNKLTVNRQRDADTDRVVHEKGWVVLRFWEHDDPALAARRIAALVDTRQTQRQIARSSGNVRTGQTT